MCVTACDRMKVCVLDCASLAFAQGAFVRLKCVPVFVCLCVCVFVWLVYACVSGVYVCLVCVCVGCVLL